MVFIPYCNHVFTVSKFLNFSCSWSTKSMKQNEMEHWFQCQFYKNNNNNNLPFYFATNTSKQGIKTIIFI